MGLKFTLAIVAMSLLATTQAARSEYVTGYDLSKWCQENNAGAVGYVLGVYDGFTTAQRYTDRPDLRSCVAPEVSRGQLYEVACKYTRDNPQTWHLSASSIVWSAFHDAFPCNSD
ncbi:Rap1a/Tai family immunity protein [Hoeflea algicola]|uniref:Rap1a/Tai family immunity protein n=1 Tax=Hoeflea algicola TaxID=2983763 RepID=UPI003CE58FF5